MVSTRRVVSLLNPDEKISHVALEQERNLLAWVEGRTSVHLGHLDVNGELERLCMFSSPHTVSFLSFHRSHLVVGDDIGTLAFYDHEGLLLESQDVDGGVQDCLFMDLKAVVLSGMGEVHLVQFERNAINLSRKLGLNDVVHFTARTGRIYVAEQAGGVVACDEEEIVWRRPGRGDHGERITGLGLTREGRLFLTREGHALVAGDEEAIEFELWSNDELQVRYDQRMRLLTSEESPLGAILGFDDGTVHRLFEDGTMEELLATGHPVFSCAEHRGEVLASSWFYIHGILDGVTWKVEHQGMPEMLCYHSKLRLLVFAGDDQNDYTNPEPIGLMDMNEGIVEADTSDLSQWFQVNDAAQPLSAEELYADDHDVLEHLTEDERASLTSMSKSDVPHDSLMAAMEQDVEPHSGQSPMPSDDDLLDALNSVEALTLEETDELLDALSASASEFIPPRAVAGDDQRHVAERDGTCVVLLDGRDSYDPQNQIVRWSWYDERGRELASVAQVKLKLPVGRHRFELRVVDGEGSWTMDSLLVHVLDGSTS